MTSKSDNQKDIDLDKLLAELRNSFVTDLPGRLDEMESQLLAIEKNAAFQGHYEALYRHAHSLKGSAGSYGLHFITSICHAMEDALNETKGNRKRFMQFGVDYWLEYIDLIRQVLADLQHGTDRMPEHEKKLAKLQSRHISGADYQNQCMVVTASGVFEGLLKGTLGSEDIKFTFCHDGYEALGRLLSEKYDILISDLEIPMLNGLALFSALRQTEGKNKHIKTILLTSKQSGSYSRQSDPDYVVIKDHNFTKNLLDTISSVFKDKQS